MIVGHTPGQRVRRVGRGQRIVLIDTGACYGGRLTAYCPETALWIHADGPRASGPAFLPARLTSIG